jgi:hypothetical protein
MTQPHNKPTEWEVAKAKLDTKLAHAMQNKRLDASEAWILEGVFTKLWANPDGQFAECLVAMIEGEF